MDQILRRGFAAVLLLPLALVLLPGSAYPQQGLAFAGCVSRQANLADLGLNAPASLKDLAIQPQVRTMNMCANFCLNRVVPSVLKLDGDLARFAPPYRQLAIGGGGNWCFCGNEYRAEAVPQLAAGNCRQQADCLLKPGEPCATSEPGQLIVQIGGGQSPPPPQNVNRMPHVVGLDPGGSEPAFPLRYEGAVQFAWQNNGDPDGDPLTFGVFIMYFDFARRTWVQLPSIQDVYGTYGMVWVTDPYFTFTLQQGLRANMYYAWRVFACDVTRGTDTLCSMSGWSFFRTVD